MGLWLRCKLRDRNEIHEPVAVSTFRNLLRSRDERGGSPERRLRRATDDCQSAPSEDGESETAAKACKTSVLIRAGTGSSSNPVRLRRLSLGVNLRALK